MVTEVNILFAPFTLKCENKTFGTASPLGIFMCLYQQNLFWYHQDPYLPTGAKLYRQKPKGTNTVSLIELPSLARFDSNPFPHSSLHWSYAQRIRPLRWPRLGSRHCSKPPNCFPGARDQVPALFQNVTSGAQPVASRIRLVHSILRRITNPVLNW